MKVLITGATGFLARRLIHDLEGEHELVLLDRVDPREATVFVPGSYERAPLPFETEHRYLRAEILDPEAMRAALHGVEAVIHLAAATSGFPEQGVEIFRVNALGTYVVLDEARKAGVGRFLCASSINAFGTFGWRLSGREVQYERLPLTEDAPAMPEDPYSLSKLVNEETLAAFHRAYGLTTAAFRFAGVWSPAQYETALERGLEPTEAWSQDLYQWGHAWDITYGLKQALEHPKLPGYGVYTLAGSDTRCPEPTLELLERFQPQLTHTLKEPLEGRTALLSIERARAAFGYDPRYRLEGAVR